MAKLRIRFVCRSCGASQSRWFGKCPDCEAWDSLEEQTDDSTARASAGRDPQRGLVEGWSGSAAGASPSGSPGAVPIASIEGGASINRLATGIGELDRVLGATQDASGRLRRGIVPGSAVLVGGEPGIGKSTLLLQAAGAWSESVRPDGASESWSGRVLYVSSEESGEQVRSRARRLGVGDSERLFVLADTNLARILEQTRKVMPDVLIIDSVQMIYKADLDASPGSISQLRRCCAELVYLAKASGIAVVLVGHVTKDGQLAGPRLLEHLVDAVLYFEGDRFHSGRIVRAIKNRFGTTQELGIFEMTGAGLTESPEGASVAALRESEPRPGRLSAPSCTAHAVCLSSCRR